MDSVDFCDLSGSDMSEEESVQAREQLVEDKGLKEVGKKPEKRVRSDNEEIIEYDSGFITVRNDKKRLTRSFSTSLSMTDWENKENTDKSSINENIIVCVTSKEILPKPFGIAKLLKAENIKNILKIQYKNPYKILIHFEDRKDAQSLINCSKFHSLDYRCQFIDEINLSYGVVKQIDLGIEEKEFLESIECEKEVVSVKRLKRQSDSGEWIQSETIRICFKSSTLPPYLLIYGCRFKVEPYTFPVSQCSGCWRFGHLIRTCPTKKVLCPKCGGNHNNCETNTFKCINCKGPHISMNKSCPVFKKEKAIRQIMCEENCTYRRALMLYVNKSNPQQNNERTNIEDNITQSCQVPFSASKEKSYRDVLLSQIHNHTEGIDSIHKNSDSGETSRDITMKESTNSQITAKPRKLINNRENKRYENDEMFETEQSSKNSESTEDQQKYTYRNIFYLKKLMDKLKEIYFSNSNMAEKIKLVVSVILEEIIQFVISFVREGDLIKKVFSFFTDGP